MTALQLFTSALEDATGIAYTSAITYKPLRVPAYKELTFTMKELGSDVYYIKTFKERITTSEEKEAAIEKYTQEFMTYVLGQLLN